MLNTFNQLRKDMWSLPCANGLLLVFGYTTQSAHDVTIFFRSTLISCATTKGKISEIGRWAHFYSHKMAKPYNVWI